ncbi:MAG: hypothetical protein ABJH05_06690 [Fulvivirga sp.]
MKRLTYILISCSLLLSSCVYSLFPIYTKDTLVYDEQLIGTFKSDNGTITITKAEHSKSFNLNTSKAQGKVKVTENVSEEDSAKDIYDNNRFGGYKFIIEEDGEIYKYKAHLVDIADEHYLNLTYLKDDPNDLDPLGVYLYPVHTFMKVSFNKNQLSLTQFDVGKLHDLFRKNMIRLRHEFVIDPIIEEEDPDAGEIIITAKPEEIQKFIMTYSKDPSVFDKEQVYSRI